MPSGQIKETEASRVKGLFRNQYVVLLLIIVAMGIIGSLVSNTFFTKYNFQNIIRNIAVTGILAVGMTFVIMTGGIDLSVGGVLALSAVIGAVYMPHNVVTYVLACIGIGLLCGAVNGLLVITERIPAFIVTLGVLNVCRGSSYMITHSTPIYFTIPGFSSIPTTTVFGLPLPGVIFIVVALIGWFIMKYTTFGRNLYAVGSNLNVAKFSGIKVKATLVGAYVVSGLCCGIAAVVYTSYTSVAQANAADAYEMSAITMAVIGGTMMTGGTGGILGTILGAIIIAIMRNIFNLLGMQSSLQTLLTGVVLVLAVLLQSKKPET